MSQDRLDKIIGGTGRWTRTEAKRLITSGAVSVDGAVVRKPEAKADRESVITVKGEKIDAALFVYYMLNKPAGYVSATKDGLLPAVTRLLPPELRQRGLFPVGRLDGDVTGLLILTDDGDYAHRVTSPRAGIRKVYAIHADGALTEEHKELLAAGVTLRDGTAYLPAVLDISPDDNTCARVTVTEGKFHEVKNLIAACGRRVETMSRQSVGGLALDGSLAPGQFRRLTVEEAQLVFREK